MAHLNKEHRKDGRFIRKDFAKFACDHPDCYMKFARRDSVRRHYNKKHLQVRFICSTDLGVLGALQCFVRCTVDILIDTEQILTVYSRLFCCVSKKGKEEKDLAKKSPSSTGSGTRSGDSSTSNPPVRAQAGPPTAGSSHSVREQPRARAPNSRGQAGPPAAGSSHSVRGPAGASAANVRNHNGQGQNQASVPSDPHPNHSQHRSSSRQPSQSTTSSRSSLSDGSRLRRVGTSDTYKGTKSGSSSGSRRN